MLMMKRMHAAILAGATAALALALPAQQKSSTWSPGIPPHTPEAAAAEKAAEEAWFAHLQFLASDELKGRRTGTPEFLRAAAYVEEQFKSIGLKPAGVQGFRQEVAFRRARVEAEKSSLALETASGQTVLFKVGEGVQLSPNAKGEVRLDAPAIFVGHGLVIPGLGIDDLKGVDLKGKIAVILGSAPAAVRGPLKAYYRTTASRWPALKKAGAVGVVSILEPRPVPAGQSASSGLHAAGAAAAWAARGVDQLADPELDPLSGSKLNATFTPARAEELLAASGHTLAELRAAEEHDLPLPKFPLAGTLHAVSVTEVLATYTAPNVVAVLEGTDPLLRRQYLTLTAHLDHLGEGRAVEGDAIYNGAMDNAAGIASLIEVAKVLAAHRPRRSILFLALTGEEEGELGSQYYARYPTVPRASIAAELNMDMYLPLFPLHYLEVQGLGESTLGNDARAAAQLNGIEVQFDKQPDENRFIRSDQASFVKYGIPAINFKFGWIPDSPEQKIFNDWIRNRYHHPNDDLQQPIDRGGAVLFDRVLLTIIQRVANATARPAWYPESFFSTVVRR